MSGHRIVPRAHTSEPALQTFWEYLAFVISLVLWAGPRDPTAFIGDNTGALQLTIDLSGDNSCLLSAEKWHGVGHGTDGHMEQATCQQRPTHLQMLLAASSRVRRSPCSYAVCRSSTHQT